MKYILANIWILIFAFAMASCDSAKADYPAQDDSKKEGKKKKKAKIEETASSKVEVVKKWNVPAILTEVSGIAYLGKNQFTCVQDEAGVIFIYNTTTRKIERQITFGAAGDYEGIALVGKTAYVVRSEGKIFEIKDIHASTPQVTTYTTPLTAKNNVEGITYDARHNRLLLAIKGKETNSESYKGIYAFDLKTKKLLPNPVVKISLNDPQLAATNSKKPDKAIQPSEIAIHPKTGAILVTEATNPQIFILEPSGKIKARYKLNSSEFKQPEGMTFSPEGELFISNEGNKQAGNITQVRLTL
ncbi:SdiA-regulated domain-containing protein [Adhaeribacter radiodurans]|uniref:SdiA-regulated domain-containing protein n=1 Tax=Adhaeribacter radiodurans TaxID=2745197 RepID=A0A7L7L8G5_9BACT|nr:SdiA-regulated domain-containing protein [Adhaeribacter radiodurans]QMU29088.1 hypothetical protein HUW48_14010 [Adhaeribacter radiodurans]